MAGGVHHITWKGLHMRKATIAMAALITAALAVGLAVGAEAKTTTVHFKGTIIGAQVSSNENVYDLRGIGIRGASIQIFRANAKGTGGTDTTTGYYVNGTAVSADKYTNSLPNANGIMTIRGSGTFVRGTGLYSHVRGGYTFTGTLNTKNGRLKVTLKGTQSY